MSHNLEAKIEYPSVVMRQVSGVAKRLLKSTAFQDIGATSDEPV